MVQIGNFHIGVAESAKEPTLSIQEAAYLWDFLVGRYKCLEETDIYLNIAKDSEFRTMIKTGIVVILDKQVKTIEGLFEKYEIPMPYRNPKSFTNLDSNIEIDDKFIYRQIFEGCQNYIDYLARISRSIIMNDNIRYIFVDYLKEELFFFDKLCKYGKSKGWLEPQPKYKH